MNRRVVLNSGRKVWQLGLFVGIFIFSLKVHAIETRYPIIYVHGVGISYHPFEYLVPLKKAFAEKGYSLLVARTPAVDTFKKSAEVLQEDIKRMVPQGPFHLVGHSMGGLVARYYATHFNQDGRVLSVTTISTPHRGSKVADWILEKVGQNHSTKNLPSVVEKGVLDLLKQFFGNSWTVVRELSTKHMNTTFNQNVPNQAPIRYFSVGSYIPWPQVVYTQNPYLLLAYKINSEAGHPLSDGPVSVESAAWGESLGEYPSDHYANTAPFPFGGKIIYKDFVNLVTSNLDKQFFYERDDRPIQR